MIWGIAGGLAAIAAVITVAYLVCCTNAGVRTLDQQTGNNALLRDLPDVARITALFCL